jgi:hypothetical protein
VAPLVRRHGDALQVSCRLQATDAAGAAEDRDVLLRYWYGFGAAHLRAEADLLLAAWDRHGGTDHPLGAAIRAERSRLSAAIASVAADRRPEPAPLAAVGRDLAAHVHRLDRELYGIVEQLASPDELAELQVRLDALDG